MKESLRTDALCTTDERTVHEHLSDFERENPAVVETLKLFGMSMAEYQGALHAMHGHRITEGNSTTVAPRELRLHG